MAFIQTAALLGSLAASAYAHGRVTSITAGGEEYDGFLNEYIYTPDPPAIVAWSADNGDNGFVDGNDYATGDIICHRDGKPGKIAATVAAGSKVEIQWGPDAWPESHHGPVIDYLAKCAGDDCTSVDKEALEFFKIDEAGLIDGSSAPGHWASDDLIANDGRWEVTIPESLAPGQYVLRHEIIGLHSAGDENGAQNYPQCFNLEVTGSGTAQPEGVLGTALYTPDDAGIKIGIYSPLDSYEIPGPALWDGASSGSSGSSGSSSGNSTVPIGGNSNSTVSASASGAVSQASATSTQAAQNTEAAGSSNQGSSNQGSSNQGSSNQGSSNQGSSNQGSSNQGSNTQAAASAATTAPSVTKIADSVPSSAMTSTIDGSIPTATGTESQDDMPSKPLPEGFTLADLLEWVDYLLTKAFNSEGVHARDVSRR